MPVYEASKFPRLRYKFSGAESIKSNSSQAYQDMFALTMLNGKKKGSFLDIGAFAPIFISNTYLLERQYGWRGVAIDIDPSLAKSFKRQRKSKFVLSDALAVDYLDLFKKNGFGSQIDYLSIDIEPKTQTLECLKKLPLDSHRFSVITYETDYYDNSEGREAAERVRQESREILQSHGYELIAGNIGNLGPNDIFEDWYVDPSVVDQDIIKAMKCAGDFNDAAEKFMLLS